MQGGTRPPGVERPDPRIIGQETGCEIGVDANPAYFLARRGFSPYYTMTGVTSPHSKPHDLGS